MNTALRHLVELLGYARSRPDHDRRDAATLADLAVEPADLALPAGLDIKWLGVAGFALSYQDTTILIDPYVSRVPSSAVLRRRAVRADPAVLDRWVPRADAVLVGHTHFDHAADVPALSERDGAPVYGSKSLRHLMGLYGAADRAVEVEPHQPYEIGPFTVRFVPSVHSKLLLGRKVPNGGELTCEHLDGLHPNAFQCGQVWGIHIDVAGTTIYHQGSADLLDDEVRHGPVDVFLCGVAGRQFTPRYLERVLPRVDPRLVVVTHHDDFFRPLGGPQRYAFGVDVARFPEEVAAVSRDAQVVALPGPEPVAVR